MEFPEDFFYTEQHEWAFLEDGVVTIGITDFAQQQLGDIVYLDFPGVGDELNQEDTFGVVESVKAVSDLYSPVSGKVIEVNTSLIESPELVNEDPYHEGWMIKIKVDEKEVENELEKLLDHKKYQKFVEEKENIVEDAEDSEEE